MKKYFFFFAITFVAFKTKAASQMNCHNNRSAITDTIPEILAALNVDTFKTKPVDTFLSKIPLGYTSMKIYGGDNPKIARKLLVSYPNKIFIEINMDSFQFINPKSETRTWGLTLFRKEKITDIEIYNNNTCINGCFLPPDMLRHKQNTMPKN